MSFRAIRSPADEELRQLESADATNPFATGAYVAARQALGSLAVLFVEETAGSVAARAIAYINGHAVSRSLEITSAPAPAPSSEFWAGVLAYCHRNRIADVFIDSYGSRSIALPSWKLPLTQRERTEWMLPLESNAVLNYGSNHKRNINKARKLGVIATHTVSPDAVRAHTELMTASMDRRSSRGEVVPLLDDSNTRYERAFINAGAARIFQARLDDIVVSSLMVLHSSSGAYYQSAGTTPEGLAAGASTFLVSEIVRTLAAEGKTVFNLGGAGPENEGLVRFKSGFGATPVRLQAATYELASPMHRKVRTAVQLLRKPVELGRSLSRRAARHD